MSRPGRGRVIFSTKSDTNSMQMKQTTDFHRLCDIETIFSTHQLFLTLLVLICLLHQAVFSFHPKANDGFRDAAFYDAHRPSYPSSALSSLLSRLNIAGVPDATIVELGAGTGKFTELLATRKEGFEIMAVEPHYEMREGLLRKDLSKAGRGKVKVVDGSAAETGIEEEWGDACIAAQAFHWFATKEALREIHRILRPGGAFGMIWNIEDYNAPETWPCTTKWEQKMKDIIWSLDDGEPRFRHQKWKDVFMAQQDTTPLQTLVDTFTHRLPQFSLPLGEETVKWTVWLTERGVWERYLTLSQIAVLEESQKEKVKSTVFEALKGVDVERNENGQVALHGVTYFAWTSRV